MGPSTNAVLKLCLTGSLILLQAISALRNKASGNPSPSIDKNIIGKTSAESNIVPTDKNSIAFSRSPAQVRRRVSAMR